MTRILIVEDEESYREPLVYQLTREGYDVSAAATGEDGLELFTQGGVDLVLLDLVIAQGGIRAGPCGGAGQEGGDACAGAGRVVGDLGVRVGALEAGDPSLDGCLLGGGACTLEVAGHGFGRGAGLGRGGIGGGGVVTAGRDGSQHHDAGHGGDGAYENGVTHCFFSLCQHSDGVRC